MKQKTYNAIAKKKLAQERWLKRWQAIEKFGMDRISKAVSDGLMGRKEKLPVTARRRGGARRANVARAVLRRQAWEALRKQKPDQPRGAARMEANRKAMAQFARQRAVQ